VDDTQLSLAIGKKGQNVRLAAKLLGWKIDIKSEEEKRQEVESAMAALVPAGAPVSVLIDLGLAEKIVEKLIESNVGTVEKLGSMTPEELEVIPGIGPTTVEKILVAVNAYYAQFESGGEATALSEEVVPDDEVVPEDGEPGVEAIAELPEATAFASDSAGVPEESETAEAASVGAGNSIDEKKEFDTIKNSEGVS
jgi:transcription termination/antitermination protein NusA